VHLLNDLVSIAHSVSVLQPDEMHVLQEGEPNLAGNAALLAAGTGMGQSFLFNDGRHLVPAPSEGGHADFAPRTEREWQLVQWLTARFGRAEVEMVVSGIGLNHLYHFTHEDDPGVPLDSPRPIFRASPPRKRAKSCPYRVRRWRSSCRPTARSGEPRRAPSPRAGSTSAAASRRRTSRCWSNRRLAGLHGQGPMTEMLQTVPIKIITNPQAGLARCARELVLQAGA
jgi:glucokinase